MESEVVKRILAQHFQMVENVGIRSISATSLGGSRGTNRDCALVSVVADDGSKQYQMVRKKADCGEAKLVYAVNKWCNGIVCRPFAYDEKGRYLYMEYVEGCSLDLANVSDAIEDAIVNSMLSYHTAFEQEIPRQEISFLSTYGQQVINAVECVIQSLCDFVANRRFEISVSCQTEWLADFFRSQAGELQRYAATLESRYPISLLHLDLHHQNIIIPYQHHQNCVVKLLDWGAAHIGPIPYDMILRLYCPNGLRKYYTRSHISQLVSFDAFLMDVRIASLFTYIEWTFRGITNEQSGRSTIEWGRFIPWIYSAIRHELKVTDRPFQPLL